VYLVLAVEAKQWAPKLYLGALLGAAVYGVSTLFISSEAAVEVFCLSSVQEDHMRLRMQLVSILSMHEWMVEACHQELVDVNDAATIYLNVLIHEALPRAVVCRRLPLQW
jgi:hypothetical protein